MRTFYKRPRAAFYRPRPELEKCLCGSASTPRRRRGIMYFRNIAAFVSCSCAGARWRKRARKKRDRGKKGRRAPRDAKPDLKPFAELPPPCAGRSTGAAAAATAALRSDREKVSLNRRRSPIRDRALAIFTRRFFASPIGARATQNVPEKASARLRLPHHD